MHAARTTPHVSICIPVYQGEKFLAETIRSVLAQTYHDFELVILDNASTDTTAHIAHSFDDPRIRVETNPTTLPQPHNWRRAIDLTRAPLIKLLCADDLLHPRCLETQVPHLDNNPDIALVAARRDMIDENSRTVVPHRGLKRLLGQRTAVQVARTVLRSGANPIGEPGGVLFRRSHYLTTGGWNPDRRWAMDLDLWIRLLHHGDLYGQTETLASFRLGAQSLSADNDAHIYHDQNTIMNEIANTPELHIRPIDRAAARIGAPMSRLRRRMLFTLSAFTSRHDTAAAPSARSSQTVVARPELIPA
jgi:glycosyltransferase involved in cell wall biosynthesis